jgi:hypothetical protein
MNEQILTQQALELDVEQKLLLISTLQNSLAQSQEQKSEKQTKLPKCVGMGNSGIGDLADRTDELL